MSERPVAVVVGVGPGLGGAVARRFARAGYQVGLLARGAAQLDPIRDQIEKGGGSALSVPCDAADPEAVKDAFQRIAREAGAPSAVIYNAGAFQMGSALEITPDQFDACFKINCAGALFVAQAAVPAMLERGSGTLIFTGATASLRGSARFACLAVGKFGLRALAQSLARELGPQGIHVAHVVIDGQIDSPRIRSMMPDRPEHTFLSPDAIAETYYQLHLQDRTAFTFELDLRPAVEKF